MPELENSNVPSSVSFSSSSVKEREDTDPLLRDLSEKKLSFRRSVVSLAAELKEVRSRLISKEQLIAKETRTRQEAEARAKKIEEEMHRLQKNLEERNEQLQASASTAQQYLKEIDDVRSKLSETQATADASVASAQSAQLQCLTLIKELDEKNSDLKENEARVARLAEQFDLLQKDLQAREISQYQLRDEVIRVEQEIMQAVSKAGINKDCELLKLLEDISPKNREKIDRLLIHKDGEIARLTDEIRIMSTHWELKTKQLESQIEKHRKADQDLKKRLLKLEFCLQESRSQTRKLQRKGELRDKALKELKDQLSTKERNISDRSVNPNFWESSNFKIVISMSMLILVVFTKR
uniref:Uncharacterized protein n=2 Tax=Kalanchoe fedtschenkoi TaxID=63787 RepID=A0A7N0TEL2_KALFE